MSFFKIFNLRKIFTLAILVLSLVHLVQCQYESANGSMTIQNLLFNNQHAYSQIISNLSAIVGQDIGNQSSFCIKDW
uniref:Uncharacterized protein n=1 Tax=Quercus lobata TaxID=97700 RepID=A0A7N2MEB0_QUELO